MGRAGEVYSAWSITHDGQPTPELTQQEPRIIYDVLDFEGKRIEILKPPLVITREMLVAEGLLPENPNTLIITSEDIQKFGFKTEPE